MAGFLGTLLDTATAVIVSIVHALGYPGLVVLMAMESMIFPVPSEFVMAPAGMLIADGEMTWTLVILASSLGSIVGSLLSYWMGLRWGTPFVDRYGKYFLLHREHLDYAERFFRNRGPSALFLSRFIPGIRHVVSIVAGAGRMPLVPFCISTLAGATLWNVFLAYAGFKFREHWEDVIHGAKYVFLAVGLLAAAYLTWTYLRRRRAAAAAEPEPAVPVEGAPPIKPPV